MKSIFGRSAVFDLVVANADVDDSDALVGICNLFRVDACRKEEDEGDDGYEEETRECKLDGIVRGRGEDYLVGEGDGRQDEGEEEGCVEWTCVNLCV